MSGENSKNDNTTVLGLASAIVSKINSLISSHNSNTSAHSDKESISNKVTSWSSTTNNTHYPSEKLVKDSLDAKQNTLVSGTTIKTVNNNSLLGSGNISIQSESGGSNITDYYYDTTNDEIVLEYDSGVTQADIVTSWSNTLSDDNVPSEKLVKNSLDAIGGGTVDSALSSTSENPVQNKVIYTALSNKINTSNTNGLVRNDGTIDTSTYLTSHQSLTNYLQKSSTNGLVRNDGSIDTSTYLTSHQDISNYIQKSNTNGLIKNDGSVDTSTYLTSHQDISNYVQKSNTSGLLKNDGSVMTGGTGSINYAIGNHTHSGYLTEMKIGSTSGLPVQTTTNGVLTTGSFGTTSGTFAEGNHTHSAYVNPTIVDNLTTDNSSQVLSAKQGKVLNDKIGNIIQIINGTGS